MVLFSDRRYYYFRLFRRFEVGSYCSSVFYRTYEIESFASSRTLQFDHYADEIHGPMNVHLGISFPSNLLGLVALLSSPNPNQVPYTGVKRPD